ncbi:MAG: MFS transporter [Oscillospiraceae bacterium]|jgi:MFS family permease|nr:MFS transporter [Oscillospiraceae bacterium]
MNMLIKEKLDVKTTILLSFGFFGSSLVWSVYNAYVPLLLAGFIDSSMVIGLVMSVDNFFGVVFQPLFGKLSDKTRTRFGRRLPYLFICMPICAVLFIFIPHMTSLWTFMGVVIIFTFVMSIWRTPAVSLMPDLTPGPFRSQANGIVNLMGGIAAILAFAGGGLLFELGGFQLPFLVSALMLIGAMAVLALFIREPKIPVPVDTAEKAVPLKLEKSEKKSLIFLLSAIFFWFFGYNAVETFFSLYATSTMDVSPGQASMMLSLFALALVAFAIPSGMIGAKIGRRKTILIGLTGTALMFLPLVFVTNANLVRVLLICSGMSWACVNINSLPMIVRIAGPMRIGTFIGYYYLFSFSSQLVTTPIYGAIHDIVDTYSSLFIYAAISFGVAFICMSFVRHGEEGNEEGSENNENGNGTNAEAVEAVET